MYMMVFVSGGVVVSERPKVLLLFGKGFMRELGYIMTGPAQKISLRALRQ